MRQCHPKDRWVVPVLCQSKDVAVVRTARDANDSPPPADARVRRAVSVRDVMIVLFVVVVVFYTRESSMGAVVVMMG